MRAASRWFILGVVVAKTAAQSALLSQRESQLVWSSCGEDLSNSYQCTNLSVPLDYNNSSDSRTINIAVTRFLGSDQVNRKGAIFVNPGGPGGSGVDYIKSAGSALDATLSGQYDLIGWDPRGVLASHPYVSCFETQFDADVFSSLSNNFMLNLPATLSTPGLRKDLERQIDDKTAYMTSLARRCVSRSGAILPYLGTAFVVRDVDYLSRLIEGDQARINYWGFSYGTLIGQYMVKILAPERLGRIVIDGVVDPELWHGLGKSFFRQGQQDTDKVFQTFASSCVAAGPNCALNAEFDFKTGDALVAKIDATIDALYKQGVPVNSSVGAIATAANLRGMLANAMYNIQGWPAAASLLVSAFKGDFTSIVGVTMPSINPSSAQLPDLSLFATEAIACADTKAYTAKQPPPTNTEITDLVLAGQKKYSRRVGERLWYIGLCHLWEKEGLLPKRSRYDGSFGLASGTLQTPILILSQTYDPVTPLINARAANDRLRNNARLIQQTNGVGHTANGQVSFCTAAATRAYFLNGTVPSPKTTQCPVDMLPFVPFEGMAGLQERDEESVLKKAWFELAQKRPQGQAWGV